MSLYDGPYGGPHAASGKYVCCICGEMIEKGEEEIAFPVKGVYHFSCFKKREREIEDEEVKT